MKVSEMIEWLKTQDQDLCVCVVAPNDGLMFGNHKPSHGFFDFDPTRHSTVTELDILLGVM